MRVASVAAFSAVEPPLWPPILAIRAPGSQSGGHAHHAMHIMVCAAGELRVRAGGGGRWQSAPGVVTGPDVVHSIDASGADILLVFLDPESDAGAALRAILPGPWRLVDERERAGLLADAEPASIMREDGVAWTRRAATVLGAEPSASPPRRAVHPRVRALIRHLRGVPPGGDTSLATLAGAVGLSPGRLMHVFTESIGLPLRPYLQWLKLQRAAAAIATGTPLAMAAHVAGFADSAHMSRTFRRTFGVPPSALRPVAQQPAGSRPGARRAS
ncbi:MAG TPA: AraC family transcriptional regulator [Kofleriaceae bacterium]|nr:AraC family transcriptional regulator [Kofleriaceae bacterium]